jgi:molecular chaperone HtpG
MMGIGLTKKKKTTHIIDQNRYDQSILSVSKYINEIAFSGAEKFIENMQHNQYQSISILIAEKLKQPSYKDEPAAHWTCDGSPIHAGRSGQNGGTDYSFYIAEYHRSTL